jgi:dihydrofolate reductase
VNRLIAAVDAKLGVANDHGIPWQGKLPSDAKYFRDQTSQGIIVMGYGTYQEFTAPLHDRENFVVARPDSGELRAGFVAITDVASFLQQRANDLVWVIGGAALFAATLDSADELYLTRVEQDFDCTKFFPAFSDAFALTSDAVPQVENGITFHFEIWHRRVPERT